MKEGSNIGAGTLCYGNAARGRPAPVLPEDAGLSLRRNKPARSRFDMEFPPGNHKWDAEVVNPPTNRQSILEDYLLEDEETSKQQKSEETENTRLGQWKSVTDDPGKKSVMKKESILPPSKPHDPVAISAGGWQQVQQVTPVPTIPPPGFPYGQPPPTYDQSSFYQYDYQQQQPQQPPPQQTTHYPGYHNYYQGYQDYSQNWSNTSTSEQPPPPGLLLPDMSQPPPMKLPVSEPVPPPATSPVPTPVPTPAPTGPPAQPTRRHASPDPVDRRLKEEERKGGNNNSTPPPSTSFLF